MNISHESVIDPSHTGIFVGLFESFGSTPSVAIKDCFDVAGEVTTSGSRALVGAAPANSDAEVVTRLRNAGYAIAGRANMHELAYGVTGINSWTGTPTNPNYPALVPGGSSSGSAVAVAKGLVDFAIGTDTGGSIRVPATCCAIVGFKPTFGRVSRLGAHPAVSSLDCVGPLARNVETIEKAMAILAPDWQSTVAGKADAKVAWFPLDGETAILAHVRDQAAACFTLVDADLPRFNEASDAGLTVIGRETWNACGYLTETGLVGRDVHDRLLMSAGIIDTQVAEAEAVRKEFAAAVDRLLDRFDVIALPAMTHAVPSLLEVASSAAPKPITLACRPFNLSGHPAIALPVGEVDGRPVSLQLVGRRGEDEKLCALARQVPIFSKGDA